VTTKNLINMGLMAYCGTKTSSGWLGLTVVNSANALDAQRLEQGAVSRLGWRRDVLARKKALRHLSEIRAVVAAFADLVRPPVPLSEGLLFNQKNPTPDSRGL
jgi:hypothetical protein